MSELISQLKGTPVSVKLGGKEASGRVVGMDVVTKSVDRERIEERYLLIFSDDDTLLRLEVAAIGGIQIKDETLARELQQQLELLFLSVKKKDRKLLKVAVSGDGSQDLTIAYSIPCPIWKTSYRLVFDAEERLFIQGVAIVDNVQEEDWTDVKMVLVSASPISFIQPLYEPIKPQRRVIEGQGVNSTGPFVAERNRPPVGAGAPGALGKLSLAACAPPAAPMAQPSSWGDCAVDSLSSQLGEMADLDVNAGEKGELFEYKIGGSVTVKRNSSALIPVVQQLIEGERLSLYNESRNRDFPYATVKLLNSTGLTLEAGPVTVMEDDSYAGECLIDVIKPDDKRFLPYALDQSIHIVVRPEYERKPIWRVQIYDGILYLYHREISRKIYEVENLANKKKILYIEHPLRNGWNLVNTEKPEEVTKSFYRFRLELDAKEKSSLSVDEEHQVTDQFSLENLDPNNHQIQWLFQQNFTEPGFIEFMKEFQRRRNEIWEIGIQINQHTRRIQDYTKEQERARENVKTLGPGGERFRQAIEESEDKIVATSKQIDELTDVSNKKKEELAKFVHIRMQADVGAPVSTS